MTLHRVLLHRVRRARPDLSTVLAVAVVAIAVWVVLWPASTGVTDPLIANPLQSLRPPSPEFLLGSDQLGRDVLSRIVYGARYSISIGVAATLLGIALGVPLGLAAGLAPSSLDEALTRVIDILSAFPGLLLALVLIAFTGPGIGNLIFALGISAVPRFARIVRSETQVVRRSGWVEHARTMGLPRRTVVIRHVLPHAVGTIPVLATVGLGGAILGAAALSFIGLGLQPPSPEWGALLAEGRNYLRTGWWISVFPGLALVSLVLAVFSLGRRAQRRIENREPL